jgi:hemin uptake protein HemP
MNGPPSPSGSGNALLEPPPVGTGSAPGPAAAESPRRVKSEELLRGDAEVLIEHQTSVYRLRRTSQGKLILTK